MIDGSCSFKHASSAGERSTGYTSRVARKGTGAASPWARAVANAVSELRARAGLSNQDLAARAGMSTSYYYTRLRGDAPFDENDVERIAVALGTHPAEIARTAAQKDSGSESMQSIDPEEVSRRLNILIESPRPDGSAFDVDTVLTELSGWGLDVDTSSWTELVGGTAGNEVARRLLESAASHSGISAKYLLDVADDKVRERVEAQLDLRRALKEVGAEHVLARAVDDVSPSAVRAIAASLRELGQ